MRLTTDIAVWRASTRRNSPLRMPRSSSFLKAAWRGTRCLRSRRPSGCPPAGADEVEVQADVAEDDGPRRLGRLEHRQRLAVELAELVVDDGFVEAVLA